MKIDPNAPAYPLYAPAESYSYMSGTGGGGASFSRIIQPGLTIRAEFVKACLIGLLARNGPSPDYDNGQMARHAIREADMAIAALNKEPTP